MSQQTSDAPEQRGVERSQPPEPIGIYGWLLLIPVQLIAGIMFDVIDAVTPFPAMRRDELAGYGFDIFLSVVAFVALLWRSRFFPLAFAVLLLWRLAIGFAAFVFPPWEQQPPPVVTISSSIVWLIYLARSKRVKNTFRKPSPPV